MKYIAEDCALEALYIYEGNSLCVMHFLVTKAYYKDQHDMDRKRISKIMGDN